MWAKSSIKLTEQTRSLKQINLIDMHRLLLLGSGSWMALICAIHCALTPILLTASPLLVGQWMHSAWMEGGMIGISMILGGIPLYKGYLQHQNSKAFQYFAVAMLFLISNILFFHDIAVLSVVLSLTGAGLMIAAQSMNASYKKACACVKH